MIWSWSIWAYNDLPISLYEFNLITFDEYEILRYHIEEICFNLVGSDVMLWMRQTNDVDKHLSGGNQIFYPYFLLSLF